MALKNTIREMIDNRGLSVYEFRKRSGVASRTAYDLANNPDKIPGGVVMGLICEAFNCQPSEFLKYESLKEVEK